MVLRLPIQPEEADFLETKRSYDLVYNDVVTVENLWDLEMSFWGRVPLNSEFEVFWALSDFQPRVDEAVFTVFPDKINEIHANIQEMSDFYLNEIGLIADHLQKQQDFLFGEAEHIYDGFIGEITERFYTVESDIEYLNDEINKIISGETDIEIKDLDSKINTAVSEIENNIKTSIKADLTSLETQISNLDTNLTNDLNVGLDELANYIEIVDLDVINILAETLPDIQTNVTAIETDLDQKITELGTSTANALNVLAENVSSQIEIVAGDVTDTAAVLDTKIDSVSNAASIALAVTDTSLRNRIDDVSATLGVSITDTENRLSSDINAVENRLTGVIEGIDSTIRNDVQFELDLLSDDIVSVGNRVEVVNQDLKDKIDEDIEDVNEKLTSGMLSLSGETADKIAASERAISTTTEELRSKILEITREFIPAVEKDLVEVAEHVQNLDDSVSTVLENPMLLVNRLRRMVERDSDNVKEHLQNLYNLILE